MLTGGHTGKRDSVLKRKAEEIRADKDQRLCELELHYTLANAQLESLEDARRKLEDSRNSLASFYEHAPIGYLTFDETGRIHETNTAVSNLLGFEKSKLRDLSIGLLVHRSDIKAFRQHLARCRNSRGEKFTTQLRLRGKTGALFSIQLVSVPYEIAGRKMFLTALVDLTERQQTERDLARAKEFAESIVETIREPLVVLDSDLKIISVNRAFEQFFRKKEALVKGQFLEVVLNMWWSGNQLRNELEKVLVKNEPLEDIPIEVHPHDLGERTLLLNARRLNQKESAPAFILVALQDITDRQQAETQLRVMNEELELHVAARTEALQKSYKQMEAFCYSIAHDLRAPLRSMKSFSDLLIARFAESLGEEGQDFTMRIQQSAERMDLLIKDLLDYGQLNTIHLPQEEVSLRSLLKDILANMESEIAHKDAKVECATDLPLVCGHRIVLQVVLTNLLSNALKFVPPGHQPKIRIRAEEMGVRTRVWVEDNGIGIAPDDQKRIFGVFQRLHSSQRYPGTGIGLALVQKGLERIGGRVGVESTPGEGSRFWIELLKPENAADQPSEQG